MNKSKRIKLLMGLLREHLEAPDNQKIAEWEDLAKRSREALAWKPPVTILEWLKEYDKSMWVDVKKMMTETGWEASDCWDHLDSNGYNAYCERDE